MLGLSMMPLALALDRMYAARNPTLSRIALVIGLGSMVLLALAGITVIAQAVGLVSFSEPSPGTGPFGIGLIAPLFVGLWLVLVGYLGLQQASLPSGLNWIGILAGAGYIVGISIFILSGYENPIVWVSWLVAGIAYPIWAIWFGRVLMRTSTQVNMLADSLH